MELSIYNTAGEETGAKATLADDIFGIEPNDHAIYLDVKQYRANQRQGTHKTKERSDIKGSRKKLRKQKGSGAARVGDIKNPIFRGGGRIFGPRPRDYGFKLNKKLKVLARKSALTYKAKNEEIMLVEDFTLESHKTSGYIEVLQNLDVDFYKTLLVTAEKDNNTIIASRNIPYVKIIRASDLNTYDILDADYLLITSAALPKIEETLNRYKK